MKILRSADAMAEHIQALQNNDQTIGLVPTMGALHKGHLSLVELAKSNANHVIVSIFVNPTQFAPDEDLDTYPRDVEGDCQLLNEIGADSVYVPHINDIYDNGVIQVTHKAGSAASGLETMFRPMHFDGVVTVVNKLFEQIKPNIAVFGEKDYQQLCVIREVFPNINIIGAPIVRDDYGLALSSRNAYLSNTELKTARLLNVVMHHLADEIREFPFEVGDLIPSGIRTLLDAGFDQIDYLELCDATTLEPMTAWNLKPARLLVAGWVGRTRLLDNVAV